MLKQGGVVLVETQAKCFCVKCSFTRGGFLDCQGLLLLYKAYKGSPKLAKVAIQPQARVGAAVNPTHTPGGRRRQTHR